jgi:16S rRNA (guanine1207-N2)-methyltransferase
MISDPAQALLLEHLQPSKSDRILVLEGGEGHLAREIASRCPRGEVLTLSKDVRDVWASKNLLKNTPNADADFSVYPENSGWDIAMMVIPKGRHYARSLLLASRSALKPGGTYLLAGPTRKGAKAIIKDAQRLFGNVNVVGYKNRQRIATCIKSSGKSESIPQEFKINGVALGSNHRFEAQTKHGSLQLLTHPGIFSWESLDEGTLFLLDSLQVSTGFRVWDVGCGYGVIGLSAVLAGAGEVLMTDVNLLGIKYTQINAALNSLSERVHVFPAAGLPPLSETQSIPPHVLESKFDLIVSNPAFHQEHKVDKSMAFEIISQAPYYLAPGGLLLIVANRFLNYDRLMREHFSRVDRVAENNKFHVIQGGT